MNRFKFRAWDEEAKIFVNDFYYYASFNRDGSIGIVNTVILEIFTGLTDCEGEDYYIGDIGEFDNGDRFVIKMEEYLEVYIEWIGEPNCEDQASVLFGIERSKKLGNIHENKYLLNNK